MTDEQKRIRSYLQAQGAKLSPEAITTRIEDAIRRGLWLDDKRDEAAARVPDELIVQTSLLGTDAMIRERLRIDRDAGIDTLRVEPAGTTGAERLETRGRLRDLLRAL